LSVVRKKKKEEGRRKKEEGRGKKEEYFKFPIPNSQWEHFSFAKSIFLL